MREQVVTNVTDRQTRQTGHRANCFTNGRPKTVRPMLWDRCPVLSVCVSVCLPVTLVYCGQTVGWIKTKLGMEVGLGPGDIVLDGDPAPPQRGAQPSPQFLAHVCCGKTHTFIHYKIGSREAEKHENKLIKNRLSTKNSLTTNVQTWHNKFHKLHSGST